MRRLAEVMLDERPPRGKGGLKRNPKRGRLVMKCRKCGWVTLPHGCR
jgi:hypothetical protein